VAGRLAGKVAFITGGASGIGLGIAKACVNAGMKVVMADLRDDHLEESLGFFKAEGHAAQVHALKLDVTDRPDFARAADETEKIFGRIHVLCNNAGVAIHGGLEAATHRDWEWVLGVNLWGVVHGIEAFVPRMIAQKQAGHIVNTASMAGLIASQGLGVYNTSKYAVVGLSETLQKDLRGYDIGVSVLCPMGVHTQIRQSDRNRPAALRNAMAEREGGAVELIGRYLPPEHVADRVLRAVYANRLYVITHEEGLTPLKRRFERMAQAIEESK